MSNKKIFHERLSAASESPVSHLHALKAFTKISLSPLVALTSGLD
jgi:hypothetical protein